MGTDVRFASIQDVRNFSGEHQALFNIGYLYETRVPVGLILKHFATGEDGWGDAHMLGVFGVSGSGKSVMAASLIAGFSARPEMGMLIIDPQAQFSSFEMGNDPKKWSWRLDEAFRLTGRGPDVRVVHIDEIALESPALFAKLLDRFGLFEALSVPGHDKREQLAPDLITYLSEWLREDSTRTLGQLEWSKEILTVICSIAVATYADPNKQAQKMMNAFDSSPYKLTRAQRIWKKVQAMFARPLKLGDLGSWTH
jgi:ABC-type dipeptide/oligopeptide/nickel transport system ATPase component